MPAVTADKVVVDLQVPTAKYIADTDKAQAAFHDWASTTITDANVIETSGARAANSLSRAGTQAGLAARGIGSAGHNTANLAAQLQDIGVQLAAGQSPFLIALQQGTQINQVIGQGGMLGAVKLLGSAFASLVNPVSLATIGIITLGGLAVQYFTTLISDGKVSEDTLKKQNDLIRSIADKWGEVVPALREYVNMLDASERAADTQAARTALIEQAWKGASAAVDTFQLEIIYAADLLTSFGSNSSVIDNLQRAFGNLQRKVRDGTATQEDANAVQQALYNAAQTSGIPALAELAEKWTLVAAAIASATDQASEFQLLSTPATLNTQAITAFIGEQERLNALTEQELDLENEVARVREEAKRQGVDNLPEAEALRLAQERLVAEERRRKLRQDERAEVKTDSAADREAKAVLDLIAALEYEQAVLGLSKEDQAVMSALRRAGAAATDEQRARIEELIRATQAEAEHMREVEEILNSVRDAAANALTTFISNLREGKTAGEALAHVLDDLASRLLDVGINLLLSGLTGGIGGGATSFAGQFFNSIFGGGRAGGGPVQAGRVYRVGEEGPETFVPNVNGTILPNSATSSGSSRILIELGAGLEGRMLRNSGEQTIQIVRATVPSMIDRRAPTSVAQAQRNRVV